MVQFKAPQKTLGDLDAATVSQLVSASSDLALVLDKKGVIRDLALDDGTLAEFGCGKWVGRPWLDVVTVESRPKVEKILAATLADGASKWRQINHPGTSGDDLPVRYSAIRLGGDGRILVIGRDLRPASALQQRLVATQAQMEQHYARLRLAETRYQTLFQLSAEAVIIVDAANLRITEANPAAARLLQSGNARLIGQSFAGLLDPEGAETAQKILALLRISPRADDVTVRLGDTGQAFSLSASIFREATAVHYLIRLAPLDAANVPVETQASSAALDVIAKMPDGFLVIDENRRIVTANSAFLELVQLAGEEQARGEPVERWLGRVEVDVDVLITNLREYGVLRRFSTVVRGEYGAREDVEVAGVAVAGGTLACYGLTIRKVQTALRPVSAPRSAVPAQPRSLEQLKELVGRVPLRELVRETTDIIEQMCIEAALQLTGDNRASAAEMLGLSRQSLYVKLRRHGLGELDNPGRA